MSDTNTDTKKFPSSTQYSSLVVYPKIINHVAVSVKLGLPLSQPIHEVMALQQR
ncbi:MAG TPA: hypothetical protein VFJ51_12895 [Nitrososphaeraceae archaeon]|nr:hypothetical protein [Nitrososphaeraceae archaeon]